MIGKIIYVIILLVFGALMYGIMNGILPEGNEIPAAVISIAILLISLIGASTGKTPFQWLSGNKNKK